MSFIKPARNSTKTLFLDRDGVINIKITGSYVLRPDQFRFIPGVIEAIPVLNHFFKNIFVVTNQQCIGKGLIDMAQLTLIHNLMLSQIESNKGFIREVFVAPHLENEGSEFRKPNTGMAIMAAKIYPEVNLSDSVMVGDSSSDMIFGRRLGMTNILIETKEIIDSTLYDLKIGSLIEFARMLEQE